MKNTEKEPSGRLSKPEEDVLRPVTLNFDRNFLASVNSRNIYSSRAEKPN